MWKFLDFSVIQILREINFEESRSSKTAILGILEALNFDFYKFLHFLKAEIIKLTKFRAPKMAKMAFLEFLNSPNLISRKISVTEKSFHLHTVQGRLQNGSSKK